MTCVTVFVVVCLRLTSGVPGGGSDNDNDDDVFLKIPTCSKLLVCCVGQNVHCTIAVSFGFVISPSFPMIISFFAVLSRRHPRSLFLVNGESDSSLL